MKMNAAKDIVPKTRLGRIADAEIPYLCYGGEGPPLIFLHATGFVPWLWHPLAREFSDYRVFAPYLCDHRDADPDNGGLNWFTLADDLARFCEGLQLEKPYLVGHSMGGTLAIMAGALGLFPVAGMVLIEPILLPDELYRRRISVAEHPLASKAVRRKNFWKNRDEARAYLHSRPLFQGWDEEMLELYLRFGMSDQDGGIRLTCSPQREAALFMGGLQYDPWPLLSRVSCPALILEGERSESREVIDQKRICSLIPGCLHHCVGGAGHLVPMENPREVIRLIRGFFRSVRSAKEMREAVA
jgi:lipase